MGSPHPQRTVRCARLTASGGLRGCPRIRFALFPPRGTRPLHPQSRGGNPHPSMNASPSHSAPSTDAVCAITPSPLAAEGRTTDQFAVVGGDRWGWRGGSCFGGCCCRLSLLPSHCTLAGLVPWAYRPTGSQASRTYAPLSCVCQAHHQTYTTHAPPSLITSCKATTSHHSCARHGVIAVPGMAS